MSSKNQAQYIANWILRMAVCLKKVPTGDQGAHFNIQQDLFASVNINVDWHGDGGSGDSLLRGIIRDDR